MKIRHGDGQTEHGPGVLIELTSEEVVLAIHGWLVDKRIGIEGPRTVKVNGGVVRHASVYVEPCGKVYTPTGPLLGCGVPA